MLALSFSQVLLLPQQNLPNLRVSILPSARGDYSPYIRVTADGKNFVFAVDTGIPVTVILTKEAAE
ncbi:MAG: hypothetical protein ACO1SV_23335 [Fimbriimonas sp.]